ncbi:hypothetical protein ACJIZ3_017927 [Penstemon smallii]|uniref:S-acyltransferase n=1 Tax=Penstemon smallii TaxID=265156 RepID=A0ABD3SXD5_9LAMI
MGFDHHCPAFGNCIGQNNHAFFMVLLVGFLISEVSYVTFAFQFNGKSQTLSEIGEKVNISRSLVLSTMSFSLIQVLWQVIFIMWHVHCACFNIKTDEWINWRKYPEFQIKIIPQAGQHETATRFINPYNKGVLRNLKEFLTAKG